MQVKISNKKIWWYVGNNNKPSKTYMDNFKKEMNLINLNVKFNSIENVEIVVKEDYLDITYVWFNHMNKDYFYIVSDIKIINNNSYILVCTLDLWNTYTLPYLEILKINNCEVLCNRSHKFDKKSIQFNDELLDAQFIEYDSISFKKKEFKQKEILGENCYYNNNVAIPIDNHINGVFYYVFKEGDNGNYTFIPLLKYKNEIANCYIGQGKTQIRYVLNIALKKIFTVNEDLTNWQEIDIDINDTIQRYINEGNIISYKYVKMIPGDKNNIKNIYNSFKDLKLTDFTLYTNSTSILPNQINGIFELHRHFTDRRSWIDYINIWKYNNIEFYNCAVRKYSIVEIEGDKTAYTCLLIEISSTDTADFYIKYDINNNKSNIDKLRLSQGYSNKFLGVYFMPNILSMNNLWEIKNLNGLNYLVCNLSYETKDIFISLPAISYEEKLEYNNTIISNFNILKYIKYKYYNNNIDLPFISNTINESDLIVGIETNLVGKINFTNAATLYCKYDLKPLESAIFKFTDELPYGTDTYINYVNATRNTTNTTYNIAKQNAIKNGIFGVLGGIANIIPGVGGLINSIGKASVNVPDFSGYGNISGSVPNNALVPVSGVKNKLSISDNLGFMFGGLNIGQGAMQAISAGISAGLSVSQLASKMKAHYADKNNVMGNEINVSQDLDTMWVLAVQDKGQYEVVEVMNLSESCIKNMNNIIYLYGEYYPRIININAVINIGEDFSYIELNKEYLSLNYYYLYNGVRKYFDHVLAELENGVRLIDYDRIIKRELITWKVPKLILNDYVEDMYSFVMFEISNWNNQYTIRIDTEFYNVEEFNYDNINLSKNYVIEIDCINIEFTEKFIKHLKRDSLKADTKINIAGRFYGAKDIIYKFKNVSDTLTKNIFNFRGIDKNIKKIYVNGEVWYAR